MTVRPGERANASRRGGDSSLRVVFTQQVIPHYRMGLFEMLHAELAADGIDLAVVYRPESVLNARDAGRKRWAVAVPPGRSLRLFGRNLQWRGVLGPRSSDLLVTESEAGNLDAWRALLTGRPYILFGHGKAYVNHESVIGMVGEAILCRFANHVLTYMPSGRDAVIRRSAIDPGRVTAMLNATDTTDIRERMVRVTDAEVSEYRRTLGIPDGARVGAYVGVLESYKKVEFLLRSAELAFRRDSRAHLLLAGDGPMADSVARFHERHPDRTTVLPHAGPADWAMFSRIVDVLLVPGRIGLIAVDALATRLPVLTTTFPFHAPEYDYLVGSAAVFESADTEKDYAAAWVDGSWEKLPDDIHVPTVEEAASRVATSIRTVVDGDAGRRDVRVRQIGRTSGPEGATLSEKTQTSPQVARSAGVKKFFRPEVEAGGFSRQDGTVEFYSRINALVESDNVVLDYGAGRGKFLDAPESYRRSLQLLRGRVKEVIGADVDDAVLDNQAVDRALVLGGSGAIDLPTSSVDLIVSDFTFEHVGDPAQVARELGRVLKPGGWICARTPNRWGSIGMATRAIPNARHVSLLKVLQPAKATVDTFPTCYRLNSRRQIGTHFPAISYDDFSYFYETEPAYAAGSRGLWRLLYGVEHITPESMKSTMMIFLRKRSR